MSEDASGTSGANRTSAGDESMRGLVRSAVLLPEGIKAMQRPSSPDWVQPQPTGHPVRILEWRPEADPVQHLLALGLTKANLKNVVIETSGRSFNPNTGQ
jgi:hypothetical protein